MHLNTFTAGHGSGSGMTVRMMTLYMVSSLNTAILDERLWKKHVNKNGLEENTLRWLFTAQQRPVSEPCIEPENGTENGESEPLPTPETVDPRQQTLFKFFKPAQSSSALPSSHMTAPSSGDALRDTTMGYNDSRSPSSRTGTDMDVDMDTDSGSDQSDLQKQGFGGFSWM